MSSDANIWMGDIKPWMNESFILNSFKYYNIHPLSVKLIHDRSTNELKNFCFINFENIEEANKCLIMLNGKTIPNTSIKFKLNWANYFSTVNKSIYVGNLSPDVDDISLYNLFKERYSSVHHASVIIENGKSKGFGFVIFKGEKDYERCLNEMNGIKFHGNIIKVSEQKKKEDDNKSNSTIDINENNNFFFNYNNINNKIYQNNNININQSPLNNRYNNINEIQNSINNDINLLNSINNLNLEQNLILNQNKFNNNIINNIININNINKINNINYINDIYNNNQYNNLIFNNNINYNNSINDNANFNSINISNHPSLLYQNSKENNKIISVNSRKGSQKANEINNNHITKTKKQKASKNDNLNDYELEIMKNYDEKIINKKIKENLEKMYDYYSNNYPGDINKLKCKLYIII